MWLSPYPSPLSIMLVLILPFLIIILVHDFLHYKSEVNQTLLALQKEHYKKKVILML
jgi:hypothetical protein